MTKRNIFKPIVLLSFFLTMVFAGSLVGQTHKVGDVYTFSDGSKGIVFEIDRDRPGCGTVVALNDLPDPYAFAIGGVPASVMATHSFSFRYVMTTSWDRVAPVVTRLLYDCGCSPAAEALDVEGGWYIPDLQQLRKLYSLIPLLHDAFENEGGDMTGLTKRIHWCTTMNGQDWTYTVIDDGTIRSYDSNNEHYVWPVRDFGYDTVRAFWAGTHQKTDTTVAPLTTTTYDALVVYKADTLALASTVTVHPNQDGDTIRETVFVSPWPYTSQQNPLFNQLDISEPGEFLFRKELQSVHGCDSAITLILTVLNKVFYTETWCPLTESHYFAPFDSVFLPGTVSGRFEHHGTKEVDGVMVDTTAYLDLVVLPVHHVYDTLTHCSFVPEEWLAYEPNEWVNIRVANGVVTVTSSSEDVGVEDLGTNMDFVVKMQNVHGCDSLLYLHLNIRNVERDTVYYELPITNIVDNQIVAACQTFVDIYTPGTYVKSDTLMGFGGCDSIITVILTVNPCEVDFTISCPPDVYDTLAFGDCVMTICPGRIGEPTVLCEQEWPFAIHNDLPEGMLFPEGENIITWTATDSLCGISTECRQRVVIAFPQCPDAVDCEGNVYHGVRIGCDCWTQRNLESRRYSDCTEIPELYEYANWLHPDTAENVAIYGRLYSFRSAVRDSSDNGFGHIQGVCPDGWYLPTPEKYAGLNSYDSASLKSPLYWIDGGGHNSTGFSALPAGFYNGEKDRFEGLLSEAYFWSTQIVNGAVGESLFLIRHHCEEVLEVLTYKGLGYSVRCIKER